MIKRLGEKGIEDLHIVIELAMEDSSDCVLMHK